ncbi:MAG TPA: DUF1570 domain-containing protein [Pyrinomonadaceae bacterium]|nr:DUF1570 domain-containing protein [Pyrinomonadaceae bacterium]
MKIFGKIFKFVCSFLLLSAVFCINASAAEKWFEVRTENFHLVGNAAPEEIKQTAAKLEQFRFVFTKLFKNYNFTSPIPTTVIVFKDEQTFLNFKPLDENGRPKEFVKGYFLPGTDLNYIALSAEANRTNDFTTIYHEYVHFLINNTLGKNNIPPWLNEGFAEYYEQFRIENNKKAILGAANPSHLAYLRKNGLMPLDKFFAVDYYTLQRQPKENMIHFYAQGWALIHFFTHDSNGLRKTELDKFSNILTQGVSAKQAFQDSFNFRNDELEKELKKYIEKKSLESSFFEFEPKTFSENVIISEISEADSFAYLGDLMLHANRSTEAEKYLRQSLSLNSESSLANTSMGFLKIKEKNFSEARVYLEKGVQNDSRNFYAQFGYAYCLSREGMSDFGFIIIYSAVSAEKMWTSLRKAIELNPSYAESYHLYAFVSFVQNQNLDEGLEMIEKAIKIAPGNQWYQIRKAELLMKKNEFSEARIIAQKVIQSAGDDQLKLYSINTFNLINNWQSQLESAERFKKEEINLAVTEKPLSEEEILKLNQIALRESLNQSLRKPKQNEQRILGNLLKTDCYENNVVFTVKNEGRIFQFNGKSFTDVIFVTFTPNQSGKQIGCNSLKDEQFAVFTYIPDKKSNSKFVGEIVSIEFVPKDFSFLETNK